MYLSKDYSVNFQIFFAFIFLLISFYLVVSYVLFEKKNDGNKMRPRREIKKNIENIIKLGAFFFLIYGGLFIFYGRQIESFILNMTILEQKGLSSILAGFSLYSLYWLLSTRKDLLLKSWYLIMAATFYFASALASSYPDGASDVFQKYFAPVITLSVFTLCIKLFSELLKFISKMNRTVKDPIQKITILIAFFGTLISFFTLLK